MGIIIIIIIIIITRFPIDSTQDVTNWRRFSRYRKWKYGVGRGRLESLSPAVCVSATMSVEFEALGLWCTFVEYQMSNVEYQTNFTTSRTT